MLSMGGKEILIKAVAQAIPTYTISCFQLPKVLCEDLEGMMRNFWWGQKEEEAKMTWVGWKKMCKSKVQGGMGFAICKLGDYSQIHQLWLLTFIELSTTRVVILWEQS